MTFSAEKTLRDIAVLLAGDGAGGQSSAEHALATIRIAVANAGGGAAKTLADLTDVALASPQNGDDLTYDQASAKWVNAQPSGGGVTPGGVFRRELTTGNTLAPNAVANISFLDGVGPTNVGPDFTLSVDGLTVAVPTSGLYQIIVRGKSNNAAVTPGDLYVVTTVGATSGFLAADVVLLPSGSAQEWFITSIAPFAAGETFSLQLGNYGAGDITYDNIVVAVVLLPAAA